MATIYFSGDDQGIQSLNGSGLGFYGAGFSQSVNVGSFQDSTWITSSDGLNQGPQVHNVKWTHAASGSINSLASVSLLNVPNYLVTLKTSFVHTSAVKTQNAQFRVYDRNNINNNPSGVVCYVAEIIHPSTSQVGSLGSGDASWVSLYGSGSILDLIASPGISGLRPNGVDTTSDIHDWYLVISASPSSVGNKTFAGYFSCEYL